MLNRFLKLNFAPVAGMLIVGVSEWWLPMLLTSGANASFAARIGIGSRGHPGHLDACGCGHPSCRKRWGSDSVEILAEDCRDNGRSQLHRERDGA